jgi:ATP/maltotriose-dependent transcriptional regulator MalT
MSCYGYARQTTPCIEEIAAESVVYDRCTGTEGQLPLAVRGIQNLLAAGHAVTLNVVVSSANLDHLPELASLDHRRRVAVRAGEWFAREGLVEEALRLWTEAGELDAAADLVGENLQAVIDEDLSRHVLRRWLEIFPAGAEHGRVSLLVAHGYLSVTKFDFPRLGELLGEADRLLSTGGAPSANKDGRFRADVAALGAFLHYWLDDPGQAIESASRALDLLGPRGGGLARQHAILYKATALGASGRRAEGVRLLERAAAEGQAAEEGRIGIYLMGTAFLHLYAADTDATRACARRMLAVHETLPMADYLLGHGRYLLGTAAYEGNELEEAAAELGRVVRMRYRITSRLYQDALIGLALVARARGDAEAVASYAADARAYALEVGDPVSLLVADSFEARLALRTEAGPVAMSAPTPRDVVFPWLEVPTLTYAETFLLDPAAEARERALRFIEEALAQAEGLDAHAAAVRRRL